MTTFLDLLPDEINLSILEKIRGYSDAVRISQVSGFSHLCDWNFWKKKVERELQVPNWYFDLPLEQRREISPSDRFLEVQSKLFLIPESVARIEDSKVQGVYFLEQVRESAQKQCNFEVCLRTGEDKGELRGDIAERIRFKSLGLFRHDDIPYFACQYGQYLDFLFDSFDYESTETERKLVIENAEETLSLFLKGKFLQIHVESKEKEEITPPKGKVYARRDNANQKEMFGLLLKSFLEKQA